MYFQKFEKLQKYYLGQPVDPAIYKQGRSLGVADYYSIASCEGGGSGTDPEEMLFYRYVEDGYVCEGTTKYVKIVKQQSTGQEGPWTNVVPEVYYVGEKIESQSLDCGGTGPTPIANLTWTITEPIGTGQQGDIYLGDNVMNHDCVPIAEWPTDLNDCYSSSQNYCYVERTDTNNNIYYHQSITDSTETGLLKSQKMYYHNGNNGDCMSLTTFLASGTGAQRIKTNIPVFNVQDNVAVVYNNLIYLHGFYYYQASHNYASNVVGFPNMVTGYVFDGTKYGINATNFGAAIYNVNKNKLVQFQVDNDTTFGHFTYKQKDNKSLYIYYNNENTGLTRHRYLENWTLIGEINIDTMEVTRYYN